MCYGESCCRPNIVGFNSRDHTQTIPDPDLHPRRPVGQGQGLNYEKGQGSIMLTTFRDYDIVMYYGGSCSRPNIVGFNACDHTQTIPDPDLHPRRPVGQGQGLNYEMRQGSIMLTTFRGYDIVMYYGGSCSRPNIVGFNSRDNTQTIPDPDLHPRRPVGQGQGLNYEIGQGSIKLTTFRDYDIVMYYGRSCF